MVQCSVCVCVFAALFRLAESYSGNQESDRGSISRSALKILLEDLSQVRKTIQWIRPTSNKYNKYLIKNGLVKVPAVVQENHVFGQAEAAVCSCFNGV